MCITYGCFLHKELPEQFTDAHIRLVHICIMVVQNYQHILFINTVYISLVSVLWLTI